MIASLLLVTLINAHDHKAMSHKIGKTGFKAGERITSASTLMKQYYNEQDWPFEKALSALQDVPAEVMTLLKRGGKTAKHGKFLVSSTELIQSDKKQVVWTAEELDRARIILNKMYDTEQAELDVLMFDCKKFLDGVQEQMDENTRIRLVLGEETAAARAEQLESTKTKKEAETNLEGLKEEYEAHQALCGSTLAAKRAELTMAELDYNVALKIENSSTCTDEQIDAAIAMDEEAPPSLLQGDNATALITNKNQMITRCTMAAATTTTTMMMPRTRSSCSAVCTTTRPSTRRLQSSPCSAWRKWPCSAASGSTRGRRSSAASARASRCSRRRLRRRPRPRRTRWRRWARRRPPPRRRRRSWPRATSAT